jgi:hypothetical protein
MTKADIQGFYRVDKDKAAKIARKLTPCGNFMGSPLYSRYEIDAVIKKESRVSG